MSTRNAGFFLALTALAACDDCTWFAPDATRTRRVGDHEVSITAEGTRKIGVDGVGAGHAFGVLWPTIEGYGYTLRIEIDERPEIELGTARFSEARMPTEKELQKLADAVEVTFSPNHQHVAYRRNRTTGWRVLHMLSHGRPFDSAHSDVFARQIVDHGALDFRPLPSAQDIGLDILREPARRAERGAFFEALEKMPHGPPWDAELLAIWPEEERTQELLEARAEPDSSSTPAFKGALVTKALGELHAGSRHIEHAMELIVESEREDALRTLDTKLVAFYPDNDVGRLLEKRLRHTGRDASRGTVRATARTKALAELTDASPPPERFRMAIQIVQAAEGRVDAPPVVFSVLTRRFPAHEPSHDWLKSHYRSAPPDARVALLTKARAHVNDGGVHGRRAAAMACHLLLLGDDGACPELASLRAVSPQDCPLPRRCR